MLHCLSFTTTLKPIVFRLVLLFMILLSRLLNAFWTTFFVFFQISKSLRDDEAAVNFHLPSKLENVHQLMSVRNEEDATYVVDPRYENFRAWRHHVFLQWLILQCCCYSGRGCTKCYAAVSCLHFSLSIRKSNVTLKSYQPEPTATVLCVFFHRHYTLLIMLTGL